MIGSTLFRGAGWRFARLVGPPLDVKRLLLRVEEEDDEEEDDDNASGRLLLNLLPFFAVTALLLELPQAVRDKLEGQCPTSFSIPHPESSIFLFLPLLEVPASPVNDRLDEEGAGGTNNADDGIGFPLVRCSYLRILSTRL